MGGYGSYLQSMLKLVPWFVVPVYTFFWQGIYRIYGHIWCIYPVLASPIGNMTCVPFQVSAELEKCQCGALYTLGAFEKHVYLSPLCLPCHTWSQERRQSSHKSKQEYRARFRQRQAWRSPGALIGMVLTLSFPLWAPIGATNSAGAAGCKTR